MIMKPQEEKLDVKTMVYGKTKEVTLPSGFNATIRESNGNDDDIITNSATSRDGSNINNYIAAIIVKTDLPFAVNGKVTQNNIGKMLLADKYAILIQSRILSLGKEFTFPIRWGDQEQPDYYTEDLEQYIWDYNEKFPEVGDDNHFEYRIKPYPKGAYDNVEFDTSSGKKLKIGLLNIAGEKSILLLPATEQTINSEIKARGLELYNASTNNWDKVENFTMFTKADMIEIRKMVNTLDPTLELMTEVVNPRDEKSKQKFPIVQFGDFFFPEEI